jgi:hypothetical protein
MLIMSLTFLKDRTLWASGIPARIVTDGEKQADCDLRSVNVGTVRIGCATRNDFADGRKLDMRADNRARSNSSSASHGVTFVRP